MSSFFSRLRRKSHDTSQLDQSSDDHVQSHEDALGSMDSDKTASVEKYQPPLGPPPGHEYPSAQVQTINEQYLTNNQPSADPGRTAHQATQRASNIGMAAGALIDGESGGNPVMGMVDGQVGGTMIAQRANQHQRHEYWREQALNYRAGLPADGTGADAGLQPPVYGDGERNRSRSRSARRDEKRKARWERRAARRDGRKVDDRSDSDVS